MSDSTGVKDYKAKVLVGYHKPVGRCIYCGATHDLSDEHIIPFGLYGRMVLPKASCPTCAKTTGRVERFCLRNMFGRYRLRFNFPTRRKKDRPTRINARFVTEAGKVITVSMPVEEHPTHLAMPKFDVPTILTPGRPSPVNLCDTEAWGFTHDDEECRAMLDKYDATAMETSIYVPEFFATMLAKIAHSYAVARLGADAFEPFLTDMIRMRVLADETLVGGFPLASDPPSEMLHDLRLEWWTSETQMHNGFVLAMIRLFAVLGAPHYVVVVGAITESGKKAFLGKEIAHKKPIRLFVPE